MKSRLQEVMSGLPVPPAATYPSAGESGGGKAADGGSAAAPSVVDIWVIVSPLGTVKIHLSFCVVVDRLVGAAIDSGV